MTENTADDPEATLQRIRDNAELAVRLCNKVCGFQFGFDQRSVAWLDGFIERLRSKPMTKDEEERYLSVYGSYLGEAIVRSYGGYWASSESGWHVRFDDRNCAFPFSKVSKQLRFGAEDSISSFFDAIPEVFALANPETSLTLSRKRASKNSSSTVRTILTDSHFIVPLIVFCIGLALLITLH